MPSRILREGILDSDAVCSLTFPAEVFYRRLMSVVDDFGRFDGRSNVLRSRLYPLQIDKVREADIARWIAECVTAGLIALYAVDARPYILFHKVDPPRSQTPKFPAPPTAAPNTPDGSRLQPYTAVNGCIQPRTPVTYSDSDSGSNAGSDSLGSSEPAKAPASKPSSNTPPPAGTILTFPTVGKDTRPWHLTAAQVADWQLAYPGVDVAADCRKALAWVLASPANTKTFGGMPLFLVKWLTRTTNSGTGRQTSAAGGVPPKPAAETPIERVKRIHAGMKAGQTPKGDGDF